MRAKIVAFNHSSHILRLYSLILRSHGYEVFTYIDDSACFDVVEKHLPHLIIFGNFRDMGTEEINLLTAVRTHPLTKNIPVLISTTMPLSPSVFTVLNRYDGLFLLTKPFDYHTFVAITAKALAAVQHSSVM